MPPLKLVALPQRFPVDPLVDTERTDRDVWHGRPAMAPRARGLFGRRGVDAQQLRYSLHRPAAEPAFGRDGEVLHIFFRRGEAPARAREPVGVVHQAETELRRGGELKPSQRLEISIV